MGRNAQEAVLDRHPLSAEDHDLRKGFIGQAVRRPHEMRRLHAGGIVFVDEVRGDLLRRVRESRSGADRCLREIPAALRASGAVLSTLPGAPGAARRPPSLPR